MPIDLGQISGVPAGISYLQMPDNYLIWHYGIVCSYGEDLGLIGQPVAAGRRAPCEIIRLHGGICTKNVLWVAYGIAGVPPLPHWETGDNEVLISRSRSGLVPGHMPDGTKIHARVGEYVYVLKVPPDENDPLPVPASPIDPTTQNQFINPAEFVRYLVPTARVSDPPSDLGRVGP